MTDGPDHDQDYLPMGTFSGAATVLVPAVGAVVRPSACVSGTARVLTPDEAAAPPLDSTAPCEMGHDADSS